MMVGFCLGMPLSLKYAKTNSPATFCQFKNAPEISLLTLNSRVLHEKQITAARLSRKLVRFPVTVLLVLPLSLQEGCRGLERGHAISGNPLDSGTEAPCGQPR